MAGNSFYDGSRKINIPDFPDYTGIGKVNLDWDGIDWGGIDLTPGLLNSDRIKPKPAPKPAPKSKPKPAPKSKPKPAPKPAPTTKPAPKSKPKPKPDNLGLNNDNSPAAPFDVTKTNPRGVKATARGYSASTYDPEGYTAKTYDPEGYTAKTYDPEGYTAKTYTADNYDAVTGEAASYNADTREVKDNATVRGQLMQLLDDNGKYMRNARTRSNEAANSRGLLNSSMAIGAGERAAIESAMPIATQDANTYDTRARTNMDAVNTERRFNAGNEQQMGLANMNAQNTSRQFNTNANNQAGQFNANAQNRAGEFTANAQNRAGEFTANAQNRAGEFNASAESQAGEFGANADNRASEFNAQQENNMVQRQWEQKTAEKHDATMANLNAELESGIIDQKTFANLRGQFLDSVSNITNEANINISEIQTGAFPADAKSKMIDQQMDLRDADMVAMEKLYQAQPMWSNNWSSLGSGEKDVLSGQIDKRNKAEKAAAEKAKAEAEG
jgi:hypothetical protein